jgi:hypothetical protein
MAPEFQYTAQGLVNKFFGSFMAGIFFLFPLLIMRGAGIFTLLIMFGFMWSFAYNFYTTMPGYRLRAYSNALVITYDFIGLTRFRLFYERISDIHAVSRRPTELVGSRAIIFKRHEGKWHVIINTFLRRAAVEIVTPKINYILECPAPEEVALELRKLAGMEPYSDDSG